MISVAVITYNSSKWIINTLESVYRQTFPDIELIISGDCSTDNTYNLCKKWMQSHRSRFRNAICTQTPHNGGICWNYNHALKYVKGDWIKYIAGDDILMDDCIEQYLRQIKEDSCIFFGDNLHINEAGDKQYVGCALPLGDANSQLYGMLRYRYVMEGSTLFTKRLPLLMLSAFDIKYPMLEDYQIAMRYLTEGIHIDIATNPLVTWIARLESVSHSHDSFDDFEASLYDSIKYYTKKYCWRYGLLFHRYNYFVTDYIVRHKNKKGIYRVIGYILRMPDIVNLKRHFRPANQSRVTNI